MRRAHWQLGIALLCLLVVCAYYLSSFLPLVPSAYRRMLYWWTREGEVKPDVSLEKRRQLLEKMAPPNLAPNEVVEILQKEHTIKTKELYDAVSWYVWHGDEKVIRQIIANRQFEMKVSLPEERGGNSSFITCFASGRYLVPLWNTDIETVINHEELFKYASDRETDPHFIYYLIENVGPVDKNNQRFEQLFRDDILSYLRIYAHYSDWPSIRRATKRAIVEYRCGWLDWSTLEEVLKIAEEKGPDLAYALYMERYGANYQRFSGKLPDYNDAGRKYQYESIFRGWCSDNITGTTKLYHVDSEDATIAIQHVQEITVVQRNGREITHLCNITKGGAMTIPVGSGKVIEIEYSVKVTPGWWKLYKRSY